METIYDHLYRDYICPSMSQTKQQHGEIIDSLLSKLSLDQTQKIVAYDLLTYIHYQWGLETFTQGVRLGMELFCTPDQAANDYPIFLNFLAQFDEPAT